MSILMDDPAETVVPAYGEAFNLVGFTGLRLRSQGCRSSKRPVGSVQVVVPFVLAQRVPKVSLVPDQRAVKCSRSWPAASPWCATSSPPSHQTCGARRAGTHGRSSRQGSRRRSHPSIAITPAMTNPATALATRVCS